MTSANELQVNILQKAYRSCINIHYNCMCNHKPPFFVGICCSHSRGVENTESAGGQLQQHDLSQLQWWQALTKQKDREHGKLWSLVTKEKLLFFFFFFTWKENQPIFFIVSVM